MPQCPNTSDKSGSENSYLYMLAGELPCSPARGIDSWAIAQLTPYQNAPVETSP